MKETDSNSSKRKKIMTLATFTNTVIQIEAEITIYTEIR